MPEQKQGDEKVEHSVWLQQATADSVTALLPLLRCNGTSPVSARAVRSAATQDWLSRHYTLAAAALPAAATFKCCEGSPARARARGW